jgi:multidrug efflux pump subunit AcrA (membrane-fusion protein)
MVEEAMLEAEARHGVVRFTLGGSNAPEFAAHAVLAREGGCPFLLTVPLELDPDLSVIVLLERAGPRAFGSRDEAELEGILDRLLPLLRLERALRPGPLARAERTGVAVLERLSERGATRPRLALAAVAAVALVLALGRGEHEIRADAFVEGRVQQAIAAPFEGYVAEASVRAGERVEAGQLVARLEDEDLRLEQQQIDNELAALDREYRQALAAIDQAQTRILQARIAQANARRGLLEGRLAQVELKAPVDGVVISGDLSRAVGTPVTKGQLLFEIAPLDAYRVVARIPEADIDELAEGQSGELLLSAFPGKPIPFVVERVSSVFDDALQTDVVFRVEGSLEGAAEADLVRLRPGMAGVARIDAGSRSLWWIYTHELGDWLRLVAWRWLP